jgi:hypothetical protein
MTIDQAIKELIKNWKEQDKEFKNKYRSYKSKYLKSLKDKKAEKIGEGKIKEMLLEAGYSETWSKKKG